MSRDKLMKFIFFCSHNFFLWYPTGSIQNANVNVVLMFVSNPIKTTAERAFYSSRSKK